MRHAYHHILHSKIQNTRIFFSKTTIFRESILHTALKPKASSLSLSAFELVDIIPNRSFLYKPQTLKALARARAPESRFISGRKSELHSGLFSRLCSYCCCCWCTQRRRERVNHRGVCWPRAGSLNIYIGRLVGYGLACESKINSSHRERAHLFRTLFLFFL